MGVDFFQSDLNLTDVLAQRIQDHIMAIQLRIGGCNNSVFVINVENNLVFGAANIKKYFKDHRMPIANHIQFIREENNKPANTTMEGTTVIRAGSNTNSKTKPLMVKNLQRLVRGRSIRVHKQCIQVCMEYQPDHLEGRKSITTLVGQLDNMVVDIQRPDPSHKNASIKRPSIIYRPEKGVDLDDGFMALVISLDTPRRMQLEINVPKRGR